MFFRKENLLFNFALLIFIIDKLWEVEVKLKLLHTPEHDH